MKPAKTGFTNKIGWCFYRQVRSITPLLTTGSVIKASEPPIRQAITSNSE